jgi:hypothetical protein
VRSQDTREPGRGTLLDDTGRVAEVAASYIALMKAPWAVAQFPFPADPDRAQPEAAAAGVEPCSASIRQLARSDLSHPSLC